MSRRVLPSRSTRGTKPQQNSQQQKKDNQLYAQMFGLDLDDDEDYLLKQAKEDARKERTFLNLQKYSYARGHTYCFDLDQFPRLDNHPSYAVDANNIFGSTYSQQARMYGKNQLSSLINRVYFGLPYTKDEERKGESRTKNICHYYLFQNEDKKYHLDRMLMGYKQLHKHLSDWLKSGRINSFSLLKKDPDLEDIVRSEREMEEKLEALATKIRILQQRKIGNISNWFYEDSLFFHHSLNQALHEQIEGLKKNVQLSKMLAMLYTNQYHLKTIIEENHNIEGFLQSALTYYNSAQPVVSQEVFNALKDKHGQRFLSEVNGQPKVSFPVQFFYFGPQYLIDTVNRILATKIQNQNQANFYTAKFAWRKLFQYELSPVRPERLKNEEYLALTRKLIEQAKCFYKTTAIIQSEPLVVLDDLVDFQALGSTQAAGSVALFKQGESVEVNQRELLIICLYSWICQAFLELLPFAQKCGGQFEQFLTCELFDKYSHGLVEAVGRPIVGTLKSNIELLCEILGKVDYLGSFEFPLTFEFLRDSNVGILRRRQEESVWETEKEESEHERLSGQSEEEDLRESPRKKIKENE